MDKECTLVADTCQGRDWAAWDDATRGAQARISCARPVAKTALPAASLRPAPPVSWGGRALSFVPPAVRSGPDGGEANLPPLRRQAWGGEVSADDGRIPTAASAPLGIYATFASTPDFTGVRERQSRAERYRLKWAADELRGGRQRACHRARQSRERPVTVELETARRRAYYGGLQVCGSVWGCPICAAKISEHRRAELEAAIIAAHALGLQVVLLTLTVRHGLGDDVRVLLRGIRAARRSLVSGRSGAEWTREVGVVGSIRALEVTHGVNGWHPHLHVLLFLGPHQLTLEQIQAGYTSRWIDACVKAGLPAPLPGVACQVQDGAHAARYVSKWGLAEELTKGHIKRARVGRTPTDLLRAYADGDQRAGELWREYAAAFKGQVQLRWSRGLRALLGLPDALSDEEIAQGTDAAAEVLVTLTGYQLRALVGARALCSVLEVAETAPEMLRLYIRQVVHAYYRTHHEDQRQAARAELRRLRYADHADRVPAWIRARKGFRLIA